MFESQYPDIIQKAAIIDSCFFLYIFDSWTAFPWTETSIRALRPPKWRIGGRRCVEVGVRPPNPTFPWTETRDVIGIMIKAIGIEKAFGNLKVLKGLDFCVEKGEVVSIMGASGAGKSTLLQILGTLSTPDSGQLIIDGIDVLKLNSKSMAEFRNMKLGFVFQFHHLLPEFSALENVMIPAFIAGRSRKDAEAAAIELLTDLGLAERLSHKPSQLSGGEQQRVAIARALINRPAVLFADEPSGNLDSRTKEELHRLFFSLRDKYGQTIVIVTHDPDLAALCDRSLFMRDGLFVEE